MKSTLSPRTAAWRDIFGGEPPPADELTYLQAVLEASAFGGRGEGKSAEELVAAILERCGEDVEDGVSEYYEDQRPTDLLYDAIRSFLDEADEATEERAPTEDDGEQEGEDDDDGLDKLGPVDAMPRMYGLDALRQMIETGQLDLNPPWQRNVVWSPKKQKELIKSILLGIPIPSIILHHQNAGRLGEETYSIIDGKQRLTAISNFLSNRFKLPNFGVDPTHPLHRAQNCYYDEPDARRKSLPDEYRTRITTTQIPVLIFRDVPEKRLREVFNLYNVTAVRLNPAEIRNAVYQNNPVHRMLFLLSGENPESSPPSFLSKEEAEAFSAALRRVLPNTKRFAALSFLSRYLGYSRAVMQDGKPFTPLTTAAAINRYFDDASYRESAEDTGREILEVFDIAQEYFDIDPDDEEAPMAFFRLKKGTRKFEALQAVTSMVCARLIRAVLSDGLATPAMIKGVVANVVDGVVYPQKQQYSVIWDYQARVWLGIVDGLGIDVTDLTDRSLHLFTKRMKDARIESDEQTNS